MNTSEDILEQGFQLAYFIFPSRPQAVLILTSALNKLKTQHGRESRRAYWRDKYLKRGITRITREEGDMLQWLIFYESDHYEREQEASHQATLKDMAVRYIKSLVRITSAMSSFHVNIGLHRLLHNYSTVETQQVYESVTDRYPGADEYRRAKSVLMNKLEERFNGMLKTSRSQHGEVRFVPFDEQPAWIDLVDLCLKQFTPWSTLNACPVPHSFDRSEAKLPSLVSGTDTAEADQNLIEINRCHIFIDPLCFGRLVKALSMEPPSQRLDLPRFFMENPDNYSGRLPKPPTLSADERKTIANAAAIQAERRQKTTPTTLTIAVDGKELARLDGAGITSRQIEINEGAELIEIWTGDAGEPLLLATHRIGYSDTQGIAPANFPLRFNAGELLLQIAGNDSAQENLRKATVTLTYHSLERSIERLPKWLIATPKFALALTALIALGWFLATNFHRQVPASPASPASFTEEKAALQPISTPTPPEIAQTTAHLATYRLVPDELATRGSGTGTGEIPLILVPTHPSLVQLELPIASADATRSFHCTLKTFSKDQAILTARRLKAIRSASGNLIVTFSVPSTVLKANTDYSVDLRSNGPHGKLEELSTYTFHAARKTE